MGIRLNIEAVESKCIVFFDGYCNLCNATVKFLMNKDLHKNLVYSSLQGETAKLVIPAEFKSVDSIVFYDKGEVFIQSDASLHIAKYLSNPWKQAYVLMFIPKRIRNAVYNVIAKSRYRIFGKRMSCRVPTEAEKALFLP